MSQWPISRQELTLIAICVFCAAASTIKQSCYGQDTRVSLTHAAREDISRITFPFPPKRLWLANIEAYRERGQRQVVD